MTVYRTEPPRPAARRCYRSSTSCLFNDHGRSAWLRFLSAMRIWGDRAKNVAHFPPPPSLWRFEKCLDFSDNRRGTELAYSLLSKCFLGTSGRRRRGFARADYRTTEGEKHDLNLPKETVSYVDLSGAQSFWDCILDRSVKHTVFLNSWWWNGILITVLCRRWWALNIKVASDKSETVAKTFCV